MPRAPLASIAQLKTPSSSSSMLRFCLIPHPRLSLLCFPKTWSSWLRLGSSSGFTAWLLAEEGVYREHPSLPIQPPGTSRFSSHCTPHHGGKQHQDTSARETPSSFSLSLVYTIQLLFGVTEVSSSHFWHPFSPLSLALGTVGPGRSSAGIQRCPWPWLSAGLPGARGIFPLLFPCGFS